MQSIKINILRNYVLTKRKKNRIRRSCTVIVWTICLVPNNVETKRIIRFYDYSLHEIGKYDLPGSIDYILKNTSSSQLHYIGYSMGSCVFFIMGSERPEYQPMIRSQISLAPVAFLSNTRSTLRYFAPYAKILNVSETVLIWTTTKTLRFKISHTIVMLKIFFSKMFELYAVIVL